jgi:hypothetical protein
MTIVEFKWKIVEYANLWMHGKQLWVKGRKRVEYEIHAFLKCNFVYEKNVMQEFVIDPLSGRKVHGSYLSGDNFHTCSLFQRVTFLKCQLVLKCSNTFGKFNNA